MEEPIVVTRLEGPNDMSSSSTVVRPVATPTSSSSVSLKTVQQETSTSARVVVTPSSSVAASSVLPPVAPSSSSTSTTVVRVAPSSTSSSTTTSSSTRSSSSSSSTTRLSSSSSSSSAALVPSSSSSVAPAIVTVTSTSAIAPSSTRSSSSVSSTSSASAEGSNGSTSSSGSGLGTGAIVGIACGGLALLVIIGVLATRSFRKRARAKRTANRTSIMEWTPPAGFEEKDEIEPYTPPSQSQSYAMQPSYVSDPGYQPQPPMANNFHTQQYQSQAPYMAPEPSYPVYAPVAAPVAPAMPSHGLVNGSMVRVKQAFVRSLDDELAIVPDQQLYLHTAYDDGWCLCENGNSERGMVPLSCLEPVASQMIRSNTDKSLSSRSERRSSLYADASAAAIFSNAP